MEQYAQKLQTAENRIKTYDNKIFQLQADLDTATEMQHTAEGLVNKLRKQCDSGHNQIEDYEIQQQESLRTIRALQAEHEDLNNNLTEVSEDKENITRELRQAQNNISQLKDALVEEQTQKELKDERLKKYQIEVETYKKSLENN